MSRRQVFYLRIAVILLIMLLMLPVSVALNYEVENILGDEIGETNPASTYDQIEQIEQEISLSLNFLKSMLQILDLNLNLINGTLNARADEYPFLQPAIEGTQAGIGTTDSILGVMESNPANLSEMETALISLNENMAQLNASLEYTEGMMEAANSTLGEPDSATPANEDMYRSLKTMAEVLG